MKLLKTRACFSNHRIKIGIIESLNNEIPESRWDRGIELLVRNWNKGDFINYDSDLDNKVAGISHKHQGRILKVNNHDKRSGRSDRIAIKEEIEYVSYCLSTISIKFDPFINGIIITHRIGDVVDEQFEWKSTDDMVFKGGYGDLCNIIGDVMTMTLNLNQHTLNFAINDNNIGLIRINTFDNTKNIDLAVSFNIIY